MDDQWLTGPRNPSEPASNAKGIIALRSQVSRAGDDPFDIDRPPFTKFGFQRLPSPSQTRFHELAERGKDSNPTVDSKGNEFLCWIDIDRREYWSKPLSVGEESLSICFAQGA